jgi:hypothetical protein
MAATQGADECGDEPAGEEVRRGQSDYSQRGPTGAGMELRVRLSTLLGRDEYPAELAGWGPVHAALARELATTLGGAQRCFAITDEQGQLSHCGITAARPTSAPGRIAACRAIVELQVSASLLAALEEQPNDLGAWTGVVTDLIRRWKICNVSDTCYTSDIHRRSPGLPLRRYLVARDRFCTMIGCRARPPGLQTPTTPATMGTASLPLMTTWVPYADMIID